MRRLCVIFAAFLLSGSAAAAAAPLVYVSNTSTVLTDAQIQDALPAFQAAVTLDFAPAWNAPAQLVFGPAPAGAWTIAVSDDSDVYGALGYHDVQGSSPIAKVFARTDIDNGYSWQVTLTHELFEMLADPYTDRTVPVGARSFYMLE